MIVYPCYLWVNFKGVSLYSKILINYGSRSRKYCIVDLKLDTHQIVRVCVFNRS